jgi:pyruvate carboxylase subunit B
MLDTGSSELIDLHAKMFKKHGVSTIRNFDALNDVENLRYSSQCIKKHALNHEVVVTMMDLPPGCEGAHDVEFYESVLKNILKEEIEFDSICFKDASGTANPQKIYETIKMARKRLPRNTHIRVHTHETAGISVASYTAALEAGADGIDLANAPVSGGTAQVDMITMMHALRGKNFDLGYDIEKVLAYQDVLRECLKDYFIPPESKAVSSMITFSPMPGGALTANTQMMRDNNLLDKYPDVIKAMRDVVQKGGYGTSVTPVSQFYFQQAFNNVMFGPWKKIADGYGKMVLGYFGKTPVKPDDEIVQLAQQQLKLEPTTKSALDLANEDHKKHLSFYKQKLENEGIETSEENLFIAASCKDKGIKFLKGDAKVNIRKNSEMEQKKGTKDMGGKYTVTVDGQSYNVQVEDGFCEGENVEVKSVQKVQSLKPTTNSGTQITAPLNGSVFKLLVSNGQSVKSGETIMILEAMKMENEILAPSDGVVELKVSTGDNVEAGQILATL